MWVVIRLPRVQQQVSGQEEECRRLGKKLPEELSDTAVEISLRLGFLMHIRNLTSPASTLLAPF